MLQGCKVRKVRNLGQADHRNVHPGGPPGLGKPGGQGVLVVHIHIQIRDNSQHRDARSPGEHIQSAGEKRGVPPKLIEDEARHPGPFPGLQQLDGPHQLGEDAAPVNVPHQEDGGVHPLRQAHVDDIVLLQVDLRRTSRPLDDDGAVFRRKGIIGGQDLREQGFLSGKVVPGGVVPPDLPQDDDLAAGVAGGLEEDGVHPHVWLQPRSHGLDRLGPAHLQAIPGNAAVQSHVLTFEGGGLIAVLTEDAAQGRRQKALPHPGHGALDHDVFTHCVTCRMASNSR